VAEDQKSAKRACRAGVGVGSALASDAVFDVEAAVMDTYTDAVPVDYSDGPAQVG